MANSAAKNGPCLMAARRNPRSAPRVQAKLNRAIELSNSDLEIIETTPPSRLRLVQPPPLRVQTRRDPPRPVRAIELSSSDLEVVETAPASRLSLAQPPPLPHRLVDERTRTDSVQSSVQVRPTSVVTRRFGLRPPVGFIAMLCIAVTTATLTIARLPDHPFKIQNELAWTSSQGTPLAPVSQGAPRVLAMKSATPVRPLSAPKALSQKARAQSSHAVVADAKTKSNGKLLTTNSTHGKSPASTGAKRRLTSTASFPVDL